MIGSLCPREKGTIKGLLPAKQLLLYFFQLGQAQDTAPPGLFTWIDACLALLIASLG